MMNKTAAVMVVARAIIRFGLTRLAASEEVMHFVITVRPLRQHLKHITDMVYDAFNIGESIMADEGTDKPLVDVERNAALIKTSPNAPSASSNRSWNAKAAASPTASQTRLKSVNYFWMHLPR